MSYQRVDAYLDPLGLVKLADGTIAHDLEHWGEPMAVPGEKPMAVDR